MHERRGLLSIKPARILWILGLAAGILAGGFVAFGLAMNMQPAVAATE